MDEPLEAEIFIYLLIFILRGHQNPFYSIIKSTIIPNFVKKYSWIGKNKLVNWRHEQDNPTQLSWVNWSAVLWLFEGSVLQECHGGQDQQDQRHTRSGL